MTRAHNTNSQVISEGMAVLRTDSAHQSQELAQLRVEMTNLLRQTNAPAAPAYVPATIPAPAYSTAPPAPAYAQPPPQLRLVAATTTEEDSLCSNPTCRVSSNWPTIL